MAAGGGDKVSDSARAGLQNSVNPVEKVDTQKELAKYGPPFFVASHTFGEKNVPHHSTLTNIFFANTLPYYAVITPICTPNNITH